MTEPNISLKVYHANQLVFGDFLNGPLRVGRQEIGEREPFGFVDTKRGRKLVIAGLHENAVSRQQGLIEPIAEGMIRVHNTSSNVVIQTDTGHFCGHNESCETPIPVLLTIGDRSIRLEPVDEHPSSDSELQTLAQPTLAPGQQREDAPALADLLAKEGADFNAESLTQWLLDTMAVFQRGASGAEFLEHATNALADRIGLDYAAALLWNEEQWRIATSVGPDSSRPSQRLLDRVRFEKRSFRHIPSNESSLDKVESVVAAPILDPQGAVVGALYGDRRLRDNKSQASISRLEAMIVELIASGVANALARLEQEQVAMKARVQFEQFFTPELARELEENPDLLLGQEAEVTLMFCDIRGFSAVSHRIGPRQTMAWINDVLETLSQCVVDQHGVLVDYIGDELMAMWGAPEKCPDHAARACEAARGMVRELAKIDERWERKVGQKTQIGIGINTGNAHVGNTGSQRKFKYGPLGNTVNLASRIQSATKMVKCTVMITENTHAQIGDKFDTRRLCQARVIHIPHPVELFELAVEPTENWKQLAATYETALDCFHRGEFRTAVERLGNLVVAHPDDGPTLVLLSRVVSAMTNGRQETHPVWVLEQK